ncbi:hypothetical protein QNN00_26000 [Bacillus velezensis]|nr:hypothetical protein [Bacillus velezensis]
MRRDKGRGNNVKSKDLRNRRREKELYTTRYKIFVEQEKSVPAENYKDGLLKDHSDDHAYQIGCYEGSLLVGFMTLIVKKMMNY